MSKTHLHSFHFFQKQSISMLSVPDSQDYKKNQPIGQLLTEAGLIVKPQLDLALMNQKMPDYNNLKLGEILALRGWVPQKTSDFFANYWQELLEQSQAEQHKIGLDACLYESGLITSEEIVEILVHKKEKYIDIFSLILKHSHIREKTLDYLVTNLCPDTQKNYYFNIVKKKQNSFPQRYRG